MARIEFKGKAFVQNYHLQVKYHELVPVKGKSLTEKVSLHDNLILHGDNLKALKALLPMYAGKVKCIYIDPPYNTGNENWVYNDNVNSPMMQEWLGKVVDKEDLTRHDKWLCMMTPRLKLLRELLAEDGVLFASIDENEQHNFRCLMDIIFGDNNHLSTFVWAGRGGKGGTTSQVEMAHEYVECYAKNILNIKIRPVVNVLEAGRFKDKIGEYNREQLRQWGQGDRREDRRNMYFPVIAPDGEEVYPKRNDGSDGRWRFGETRVRELLENGDIDFVKNENGEWIVYRKIRAGRESLTAESSLLLDCDTASKGTIEIKQIFGEKVFDTTKPLSLIKHLISCVCWNTKDAIILDSYAGSGTTAQAVLEINRKEDKDLKFILIQLPEQIDEKHIAYKMGYKQVIEVTAERVRRVIKGVKGAKDEPLREGYGGSFSYFELGKAINLEEILTGKSMPSYEDLARYVFYTATGEEFDPKAVKPEKHFIGESKDFLVYLFYQPDLAYLKQTALTMERARQLGAYKKKRRLVFAPTKYLDQEHLDEMRIDFSQLPFEIYQLAK